MPIDDFGLRASNQPQQAEAFAANPVVTWRQSERCWHCFHDTLRAKQHGHIIDEGGLNFQTHKSRSQWTETADALRRNPAVE